MQHADWEKGPALKSYWRFSVPIFLGEIVANDVRVELFADAEEDASSEVILLHKEQEIPGAINGHVYAGVVPAARPVEDYSVRIVPYHEAAQLPAELPLILWQR